MNGIQEVEGSTPFGSTPFPLGYAIARRSRSPDRSRFVADDGRPTSAGRGREAVVLGVVLEGSWALARERLEVAQGRVEVALPDVGRKVVETSMPCPSGSDTYALWVMPWLPRRWNCTPLACMWVSWANHASRVG